MNMCVRCCDCVWHLESAQKCFCDVFGGEEVAGNSAG